MQSATRNGTWTTVGSRELKTRLGTYLRHVQPGVTIIVTDRGRPVAELRPLTGSAGDIFEPIRIGGEPLSNTIRDEREDRF